MPMTAQKRIFLAGIIQGSEPGKGIVSQDYRPHLKRLLAAAMVGYEVYCPVENHPHSVHYTDAQAHDVFVKHVNMAADSEIVVAFVPQASMGTAIEIWQAHRAGRIVLTISPMAENWVVKLFSSRIFATLAEFETFVTRGQLRAFVDERRK